MPDLLTVGEVAKRSGVAVSALHFYESKGLIRSWRSQSNQRRYPRQILRHVAIIKAAQHLGFSLAAILKAFGTLPKNRAPVQKDWERLAESWQTELDDRIARLTLIRNQLTSCIGCGCLSMGVCPLLNPGDKLSAKGPGARLLEPKI